MKSLITLAALSLASVTPAFAETFNFDAGTDAGLTRYDPLAGLGFGGTYSFPGGNSYRIQTPSTGAAVGLLGPGRAGGAVANSYTDFTASVDLVNWDDSLAQTIGLLGRIQQPGRGTADGYGFIYLPAFKAVAINRFDDENPTALPSPESPLVNLNPGLDYRLVFSASGSTLKGQIFGLDNLLTPLVSITVHDATYGSGEVGVLVAGSLFSPLSAGDATFDDLVVVPEPGTYAVAAAGLLAGFALWKRRGA